MMATVFQRLGPYEILDQIGKGGMAQVFLAIDTRTKQQVALRLVPVGVEADDREILDAEQWGAKLQEQFCRFSPHVPAVYEHAIGWGYFYIAMEYVEGQNLSAIIAGGRMPSTRAVFIAIELCHFLEAARAFEATIDGRTLRSLIHSDLHPRNIRITKSDEVKVIDFGIAKALSLSRKVTRNDFGNLPYLSPERLESGGEMDAYADFWALGVLLYEMVSGELPFRAPDTRRLEQRIKSRRPPPSLPVDSPIGLQAILAKLLAAGSADRYGSGNAIRADLERFRAGTETEAERDGWLTRGADEAATQRTRAPAEPDEEATRRTPKAERRQDQDTTDLMRAGDGVTASTGSGVARRRGSSPRRFIRKALLLLVLSIVVNEIWIASAADRLAGAVSTRELDGLADVWSQYDVLAKRSYLRMGVLGLERSLTRQSATLADRVVANYRTSLPTVREPHWRMAREALARAVALHPNNSQLKASLWYCDGHLHRIDGQARKGRREDAAAQHEFTEAITAFREAIALRSNWPDPFLGLARTFIYGLEDVDRGADALNQAQRLGYALGDRETAQLADGYRARGETIARTARKLGGLPQEQEYLTRAADAYRQALTLYAKVISYADVPANIRRAQRGLEQIDKRLAELSSRDQVQPWG